MQCDRYTVISNTYIESFEFCSKKDESKHAFETHRLLKPSLSMKILSINNFTTKLLSKLLSDLYIGVHLKGAKKFGSKVINRQFFHRKTVFSSRPSESS